MFFVDIWNLLLFYALDSFNFLDDVPSLQPAEENDSNQQVDCTTLDDNGNY